MIFLNRIPIVDKTNAETKSNVDNALISGDTPNFIIENIFNGKVVEPGPATKKVITKSSMESVMLKRKPATMPGEIRGMITLKNACEPVAPRSLAASTTV